MFKLFTQAKVFQNIQALEAFLMENGLRTPYINRALDQLETLLKGTPIGKRYDDKPKVVELSEAAKRLKEKIKATREAKARKVNRVVYKTANLFMPESILPIKIAYQEAKGKTTLVFGTIGSNIYTVSATLDEKDKFHKLTGFLVAMTKHLYTKKEARKLINIAYTRYPKNPKAFLEGVVASKLKMTEEELTDFMYKVIVPGEHLVKYNGHSHKVIVVD